jgi:hypothetical protein
MPITKTSIFSTIAGVIIGIIGIFALYTWAALSWSYSKGERTGYVQKFSSKGWLCKTWEGELTMLPLQGMVPEKFIFSVRDDAVADSINRSMSKKLALTYEQHKGVPTSCFGESEYFVTAVKVTE